jgi:hypothetical protein
MLNAIASTSPVTSECPDDVFLNSKQVRQRYGGVSTMWIFRREHDPRSSFPRPIVSNRRKFWRLRDLVAWERRLATGEAK